MLLSLGCINPNHKHHRKVKVCRTYDSDTGTWLYWYVMTSGSNNYYYSSSSPTSSFNGISWKSGLPTFPQGSKVEEMKDEEVEAEEAETDNESEAESSESSESDSGSDSGGDSGGSGGGGD